MAFILSHRRVLIRFPHLSSCHVGDGIQDSGDTSHGPGVLVALGRVVEQSLPWEISLLEGELDSLQEDAVLGRVGDREADRTRLRAA